MYNRNKTSKSNVVMQDDYSSFIAMAPESFPRASKSAIEFDDELDEEHSVNDHIPTTRGDGIDIVQQSIPIYTRPPIGFLDESQKLHFRLPSACKSLMKSSIAMIDSFPIGGSREIQSWIVGQTIDTNHPKDALSAKNCYQVSVHAMLWGFFHATNKKILRLT